MGPIAVVASTTSSVAATSSSFGSPQADPNRATAKSRTTTGHPNPAPRAPSIGTAGHFLTDPEERDAQTQDPRFSARAEQPIRAARGVSRGGEPSSTLRRRPTVPQARGAHRIRRVATCPRLPVVRPVRGSFGPRGRPRVGRMPRWPMTTRRPQLRPPERPQQRRRHTRRGERSCRVRVVVLGWPYR